MPKYCVILICLIGCLSVFLIDKGGGVSIDLEQVLKGWMEDVFRCPPEEEVITVFHTDGQKGRDHQIRQVRKLHWFTPELVRITLVFDETSEVKLVSGYFNALNIRNEHDVCITVEALERFLCFSSPGFRAQLSAEEIYEILVVTDGGAI